jgi:hypothetical protein
VPSRLADDLARWTEAGLLSGEQAAAIAAFEGRAAGPPRRISLATEAFGYVGAALATAGAVAALGRVWEDLTGVTQFLITAGAALALVVAGAFTIRNEEPAFRRLGSVLWFLAVGAVAGSAAVLTIEVLELPDLLADETVALIITTTTAIAAAVLWRPVHLGLQQAALFGTVLATLVAAIIALPGETGLWVPALGIWLLGLAWFALGWWERLTPGIVALALGTLAVLVGPSIGVEESGWMLIPALLSAGGAMVASIPTRFVPLLVAGTVGLFAYLTWAVVRYFGDSLGVPVALVLVGGLFIGLAVAASRLRRLTLDPGPHPAP